MMEKLSFKNGLKRFDYLSIYIVIMGCLLGGEGNIQEISSIDLNFKNAEELQV
jgi:hypothetical protein